MVFDFRGCIVVLAKNIYRQLFLVARAETREDIRAFIIREETTKYYTAFLLAEILFFSGF